MKYLYIAPSYNTYLWKRWHFLSDIKKGLIMIRNHAEAGVGRHLNISELKAKFYFVWNLHPFSHSPQQCQAPPIGEPQVFPGQMRDTISPVASTSTSKLDVHGRPPMGSPQEASLTRHSDHLSTEWSSSYKWSLAILLWKPISVSCIQSSVMAAECGNSFKQ